VAKTPKPVVVLFDVDETLVHTGGSGARSWNRSPARSTPAEMKGPGSLRMSMVPT
jgi:phosphoglycolate phosphatase-like HAD superfamily hydrolase